MKKLLSIIIFFFVFSFVSLIQNHNSTFALGNCDVCSPVGQQASCINYYDCIGQDPIGSCANLPGRFYDGNGRCCAYGSCGSSTNVNAPQGQCYPCGGGGGGSPSSTPVPTINPIPNCYNLTANKTTYILGDNKVPFLFTALANSDQGQLSAQLYEGASFNAFPNQTLKGTTIAGTISVSWIPTSLGTYTISCRAWNDSIAECRPSGPYHNDVDGPPRYACAGPTSQIQVNVIAPSNTPTPTLNPIPNCKNLVAKNAAGLPQTQFVKGSTVTLESDVNSAQGFLNAELYHGSLIVPGPAHNSIGWYSNTTPNTVKSGKLSANWIPSEAKTYTVSCRAWNDSIAECRPGGPYSNEVEAGKSQYPCDGPTSQILVDVILPSPTPTAATPPSPTSISGCWGRNNARDTSCLYSGGTTTFGSANCIQAQCATSGACLPGTGTCYTGVTATYQDETCDQGGGTSVMGVQTQQGKNLAYIGIKPTLIVVTEPPPSCYCSGINNSCPSLGSVCTWYPICPGNVSPTPTPTLYISPTPTVTPILACGVECSQNPNYCDKNTCSNCELAGDGKLRCIKPPGCGAYCKDVPGTANSIYCPKDCSYCDNNNLCSAGPSPTPPPAPQCSVLEILAGSTINVIGANPIYPGDELSFRSSGIAYPTASQAVYFEFSLTLPNGNPVVPPLRTVIGSIFSGNTYKATSEAYTIPIKVEAEGSYTISSRIFVQ